MNPDTGLTHIFFVHHWSPANQIIEQLNVVAAVVLCYCCVPDSGDERTHSTGMENLDVVGECMAQEETPERNVKMLKPLCVRQKVINLDSALCGRFDGKIVELIVVLSLGI